MKIAFVAVRELHRGGGIEKYTLELGRRLVARGHEVSVFSMGRYGRNGTVIDGMKVVTVPALRSPASEKMSATAAAAVRTLLQKERPDVIHCHSVAAGALGPLFRLRGARTVLQMHGLEWKRSRWSSSGRSVLRALEVLSMRGHHSYTAVSRQQCDHFRQAYGLEFAYIPTGTEIRPPTPPELILRAGLVPNRYLLFASRLVREKGAQYLIDAFRRVDTDCKLVVAGDPSAEPAFAEELRRAAAGDQRIIFPGHVGGQLLEELFSHACVYTQPSEVEGLSIALLEAMGHGRCCLVSDIDENLEAIGHAGVAFEQKNPIDLATKLRWLLADASAREALGAEAKKRIQALFLWDGVADAFESLYRAALRN